MIKSQIDYLKWRWRVRGFHLSRFYFKDIWYDMIDFFKKSLISHGISTSEIYNPDYAIAEYALKVLHWMSKGTSGVPSNIYDENNENEEESWKKWSEIINRIRFSFFYFLFIQDDRLGYKISKPEDKEFCRKWSCKKYWYVKDFLTKEFFEEAYPDEMFNYDSKIVTEEVKDRTDVVGIKIITFDKRTNQQVDVSSEVTNSIYKMEIEKRSQYEEGLQLFAKYFGSLWD